MPTRPRRPSILPVLCLAVLAAACGQKPGDAAADFRASVATRVSTRGRIERTLAATGTVRATEAGKIVAEAGGKLLLGRDPRTGRRLAIGDRVERGQLIAVIAADELATTARLVARRQALDAARAENARNRRLLEQGLLSANQMSDLDTRLANAQAEYDAAELQLSKSRQVAPIGGVITSILTSPDGEFIAERTAIAEVMQFDEVIVDLDLGAADILDVEAGQTVRIGVPGDDAAFEGLIARVAPAIDPKTRTFRVEVGVRNPDGRLRPGMFVRADIVLEARTNVVLVPSDAVVVREGVPRVFEVVAQRAVERKVGIGLVTEESAEITEGLEEGAPVVVTGQATLDDGVGVIVRE